MIDRERMQQVRGAIALVTAVCLVETSYVPIASARQTTGTTTQSTQTAPAKPAATTPATTTSSKDAGPPDGGWPRGYSTANGEAFLVYQPQVSSWDDQKKMIAFAAVAFNKKGASPQKPDMGTIRLEADTKVSLAERLVEFTNLKLTDVKFPTLSKDQTAAISKEISDTLQDRVLGLDRVLESIDTSKIIPKNIDGIKADPPTIFFSKKPAILVNLDSDPIWAEVKGTDLKYAVNTNWDLFQLTPTNTYYLRNDQYWLQATDIKGPWTPVEKLPDSFKKLPADDNWKDTRAAVPGKKYSASNMPTVFVSTTPAELMLLKGEPAYKPVEGTGLMWVSNTESDVFRVGTTGAVYYLVAGRWFSAGDFNGPWVFATPNMPEDFQKIPLEHERSRVLASVPGTPQAAEAILLASIPQTARVEKKTTKAPDVTYNGTPQFEPIEKTTVSRATNTDKDIIKVGDLYYMCFQGVWFMSRTATGPWEVTGDVPKAIYEIPPSSPSYNVTYVTVEDDNDDAVVFATAMAYTGIMIAWGCAVWGTGYYYPPYYYGGVYRPYYPTYGYSAWYNPWTGTYGRGYAAYGPYGGAGYGARYNPATGAYARGGVAYGPGGARGYAEAYNPRTGGYAQTRQGSNVYGSWGQTSVQRGDQWATTSRYTNNRTGTTTRVTQGSGGGTSVSRNGPGAGNNGFVAQGGNGDVYAGRDGNVYRKQGDSWQQYGDGGWNNVNSPTPNRTGDNARTGDTARAGQAGANTTARTGQTGSSPTVGQLDRDSTARANGAQRTQDLGSYRSGSMPSSRSSSYRPSGGASRGGGVRRGRGELPVTN